MLQTNVGDNDDNLGVYIPYPPSCKCSSNNTACQDFWTNTWQCLDCHALWSFKHRALPPYYDPNFPYPEIQEYD